MLEALRHGGRTIERRTRRVAAERTRLLDELRGRPFEVVPSQANVLWIAAPAMDGAELAARLGRQRVIVRAGGPLGDARHVRVAIQDKLATDRFLRALELALDEG